MRWPCRGSPLRNRRRWCILWRVQADRRPSGGVCVAVDVHYLPSGEAQAAAVVAADVTFCRLLSDRTGQVAEVPPYHSGQFYLREMPPLHAVLDGLDGIRLLIVDGYADLDPGGRPGLGAHAHAEFGVPVIGVAKTALRTATHAVPVMRGESDLQPYGNGSKWACSRCYFIVPCCEGGELAARPLARLGRGAPTLDPGPPCSR